MLAQDASPFPAGFRPPAPADQTAQSVQNRSSAHVTVSPLTEISEALAIAWDDLASSAAEPNVFAERWFAAASADHLDVAGAVRLLAVWDEVGRNDRLIGLMPVVLERHYGRLKLTHVENWMHHHCFLGAPLLRAGHEREGWTAILTALDAAPWARGFLHVVGLSEGGPVHCGLVQAAKALGRRCDVVHRIERAFLKSDLSPKAYYEATVRKKKRKEHRRLAARLSELGQVSYRRLGPEDALPQWCDDFLALERSGWKGKAGSALASSEATEGFFRDAMAGAHRTGRLEMIRLDLDGRPIAMLVNFFARPGAFSFKIAFDEAYARYSPGVLVQLENLAVLDRPDVQWMDSCAVEDHPMINSLWAERRAIVRVTVPLAGARRAAAFRFARLAERLTAFARRIAARNASSPLPSMDADDD